MKANELMVGDFVFHEKYGNAIIEIINNDFEDNPSVEIISENIKHKDGYKYGYCWCDLDEIFPIPLTPEILEKNGFIIKKKWAQIGNFGNSPLIVWHFEDDLILHDFKHELEIHQNDTGKVHVKIPCEYVHELQHALKLCGIEKTIEL